MLAFGLHSVAGQKVSQHMSHTDTEPLATLEPFARAFYQETMTALNEAGIPYLIGGAYSLERYTGIARHTKDLDVFARPGDCPRILDFCARRGDTVDLLFPHWLGKVYRGEFFIDIIFSSGNGVADVDDNWFARARRATVLGVDVLLCPPEETIWSKAFIMERERFDGADVAHLLRACAADMDWAHLLKRFGRNWQVLLAHLVMFGYIYPQEKRLIPAWVMDKLTQRLSEQTRERPSRERLCRGTLLSREQYLADIHRWGYRDPRMRPHGKMSPQAIAHWTAAIAGKG